MTLSASDATKIRHPHHHYSGARLLTVNAVPLTIVAEAQINQTEFLYPLAGVTVDNTSADWLTEAQVGRMVMIGTAPRTADVTYGVIRKATTSNTLYLDAKYPGEPGYARDVQQVLADNQYISIVKFRPAWGLMSSIRKGVFYKFWDLPFSASQRHPHDLINLGPHQQADVDPAAGKARFTIEVDPYYWTGQTYSSHTWGVDGQTVVSSSQSQLVIDCEPGCHEITYRAINSRGKVTTAYRYLFANDDTDFPPLNARYSMAEIDCQQDALGCSFTLTFEEPVGNDVLFPGQLFLLTEAPMWGSYTPADLVDPAGVATNFVGYALETARRTGRGLRATTVTLEGPIRMAKYVPIEKQIVMEKKTPGNWAEVKQVQSNPVGVLNYLSSLHAPYLVCGHDVDFDPALLDLRRKIQNLDQGVTMGEQIEQLTGFLDGPGVIGSRADGTTVMHKSPLYMTDADRGALDTQWTYIAGDITGELERPLRFRPQVGKTFAGAFAYGGSSESKAFRSLAPGYVRSQAGGETTLPDTTVTLTGGQRRVNEIAGFHHAVQNTRSGDFEISVNGNMDVAQPAAGPAAPTTQQLSAQIAGLAATLDVIQSQLLSGRHGAPQLDGQNSPTTPNFGRHSDTERRISRLRAEVMKKGE